MTLANIKRRLLSVALACQIILLAPASAYGIGILQRPPGGPQDTPWYVTLGAFFIQLLVFVLGGIAGLWATRRPNIDALQNADTPGMKLRLWCGYMGCSADHVLVQLIADIQFEYHAAIRRGDFAAAQRIVTYGYIDFARTLIVYVAVNVAKWLMKNLNNIFRAG